MITSVPIEPPWDQGDKNFAHSLIKSLPQIRFGGFSSVRASVDLADNFKLVPVYKTQKPSLLQKARVLRWLDSQNKQIARGDAEHHRAINAPNLYHLIYRPNHLSTWFFRRLPEFLQQPLIHTIPATADERINSQSLFFARRLVALSLYGQRKLESLGLDNVTYIPMGIDYSFWKDLRTQREASKRSLGLDGHPVILYPGHFGHGYGMEMIIEALRPIVQQIPDVKVIFACRMRSRQDYEAEKTTHKILEKKGLDQAVTLFHTVSDMSTLIAASDLVTLPLETMRDKVDTPTTLLEALAAGKPIITTDLAPMNEVFDRLAGWSSDDCIGVSVKPGDLHGFVRASIELLTNLPLRERMGTLGQMVIEKRYNICHVARQYENLYLETLG